MNWRLLLLYILGRRAVIGVWLSHRWQLCPSCGFCISLIFLYFVAYQRVYIFFIRLPKLIPSLFFGDNRLSVGAIILSRKGQIGSQVLSFQVWISNYISRFKIFNVLFSLYFVCICLCYVLSVHVCLICLFQYWFCLVMTFIFKISSYIRVNCFKGHEQIKLWKVSPRRDLNQRPSGYMPDALTNWATGAGSSKVRARAHSKPI